MNDIERQAHIQLALTPYIGAESFSELIQHYGSATEALKAPTNIIAQLGRHGKKAAAQWHNPSQAQAATAAALKWEQQPNCRILLCSDPDFPSMLKEGITAPPILFTRGNISLLHQPAIAIIGSRHATPQAIHIAHDFAKALSQKGITVISGMAAGIDTAAHQGALPHQGKTIAVWGTGIDRIYPHSNQQLAYQIAEQGLILSEFPLGTRPIAGNFPRRNRLIAAQSHAILVIEAGLASGSLITAQQAIEMGREVMAVPGSINNPNTKGCHQLIKSGAKLIECLDDILNECPIFQAASKPHNPINQQPTDCNQTNQLSITPFQPASIANHRIANSSEKPHQYTELLTEMGYAPIHPDMLAQKLNIPSIEVYAALTELELAGWVSSMPGGQYQLIKNISSFQHK